MIFQNFVDLSTEIMFVDLNKQSDFLPNINVRDYVVILMCLELLFLSYFSRGEEPIKDFNNY